MAMDERQQQIKEGAGLEESRLNREFIDFLSRWGTTVLMVGVLCFLAYAGWERWQKMKLAKVDRAFEQLESLLTAQSPSPESLKAVADEFGGIRAVPHLARLRAADIYLEAARRGVRPGANFSAANDGTLQDPADLLGDEDRQRMLNEAEQLYSRVLADTETTPTQALHAIGAAYGLAAVAECRGDSGAAKALYERVAAVAKSARLEAHATVAGQRITALTDLAMPRLYASAELPKLPWAVEVPPAAGSDQPSPVDPGGPLGAGDPPPPETPASGEPLPAPASPTPLAPAPAPTPAPLPATPPSEPPPSAPPPAP